MLHQSAKLALWNRQGFICTAVRTATAHEPRLLQSTPHRYKQSAHTSRRLIERIANRSRVLYRDTHSAVPFTLDLLPDTSSGPWNQKRSGLAIVAKHSLIGRAPLCLWFVPATSLARERP